jgi:hypothetical protein
MGMDSFAPGSNECGCFIVRNISPQNKTIRIFNYPINMGCIRDLLEIRGVSEGDIKSALTKGEIRNKFKVGDIELVYSNIDLLQFNDCGIQYLEGYGFTTGVLVGYDQLDGYVKSLLGQGGTPEQQDIQLVGAVNGMNTIFTIPTGTWIQNPPFKIIVYKNGVKQVLNDDYIIAEGGGLGTGYNTVIFSVAPEAIPAPPDVITADYYLSNAG